MVRRVEAEAAVVQAFNNLSRPEKSPSGLPNHWHFTVRHVDLQPPGDLVHIVNPNSHYTHCAGPTQILSLPSRAAQADAVVPLLLDSFIQGITTDPSGKPAPEMTAFAPWTWATSDRDLAKAVEKRLGEVGVKKELCTVQPGNKEDERVSDGAWADFMKTLKDVVQNTGESSGNAASSVSNSTTACASCKKDRSALPNPLKICSRCGGPRYCSQECQKSDWKQHKKVCKPSNSSQKGTTSASTPQSSKVDAVQYYNKVAHKVPEAQSLARSVNLTLPTEQDRPEGIMKPIRRLVATGKDTPENFVILFGPRWKETQGKTYEEVRLCTLINPPPGSPSYVLYAEYDQGSPAFSPRPPNDAEKAKLQKVRDMQAAIGRQLGSRKEPTVRDMQAVLAGMGQEWTESLPIYEFAINTIDQGVNVP